MSTVNTDDPLAGLHQWEAYMAKLQQELQDMQAACAQDLQVINDLQGALNGANGTLNDLINELEEEIEEGASADDIAKTEAAISAQEGVIGSLQGQLSGAQAKLSQDQAALAGFQSKYGNVVKESTSSAAANTAVNGLVEKTTQDDAARSAQAGASAALTQSSANNAEASRQNALKSVGLALELDQDLAADAIQRIANIKNDIEGIHSDEAEEKVLKDKIIEDAIKLGAAIAALKIFGGLTGGLIAMLSKNLDDDRKKLADTEDDEKAKRADLAVQQGKLKSDLDQMKALDLGDLNKLIDSLFDTVGKLVALIGKDGKVTEGGMQEASVLIAEVMSIVAMITSKVHQLRSADQQWMARANAANSEIAADQSKVTMEHMADLEEFASFMKTTMKIAQYGAEAATGIMALASGGALAIAMAALMIYLSESGMMNKWTTDLAKQMSSNGAVWAKVLADVTVAVAAVVVTHSAAGIEGGLASAVGDEAQGAARAGAEVSEEVEIELAQVARNAEVGVENAAEEVPEAAANVEKTFVQRLTDALGRFFTGVKNEVSQNFTPGKTLGMTGLYFGTANGVVDTAEFGLAVGTKQADATEKELEKDEAEILMILKIVAAVVQAIGEIYCGGKVMGGSEAEVSMLQRLTGSMKNFSQITTVAYGVQNASSLAGAMASACLASNSYTKGQLTEMLGKAQADLTATQAVGKQAKLFEKKEIELFASKLKQEIEGIEMMIKKAGQAETEAAKVLQQTAV